MRNFKIAAMAALFVTISGYAQAQSDEWEPQTHVTGYVATQVEYIPNLQFAERDYGISLSEAGLLATYMPKENLTIKMVAVYKPNYSIDQILNELSADLKLTSNSAVSANLTAGRFLTPVSPINTNFYAPVNVGINLPLVIAHHEYFPININGLSLNGVAGDEMKFNYNAFVGGYYNTLFMTTGPLGFFGNEDGYFYDLNNPTIGLTNEGANTKLGFGGGLHLGGSYGDIVSIGANYFGNDKSGMEMYNTTIYMQRHSLGFNIKLKYSNFQFTAEDWWSNMTYTDLPTVGTLKNKNIGSFYELSYNYKKFTPYTRFEQHDIDIVGIEYNRYTVGLNFKPNFETTIKAEYVHYDYENELNSDYTAAVNGYLATLIYSF